MSPGRSRGSRGRTAGWRLLAVCALGLPGLGGCDLTEVSLAAPERVVVAEAYLRVEDRASGVADPFTVFLHETLGPNGGSGPVPGARVVVRSLEDGDSVELAEVAPPSLAPCVIALPVEGGGSCYVPPADAPFFGRLAPGDRLALRIDLPGGGVLESETVIPGDFRLLNVRERDVCAVDPLRQTRIVWSRSPGAWAYVSDTFIAGLGATFGDVVADPLYLLGLSVSAGDTAIVFPAEFGLFARTELDREVSVTLQQGLPEGTSAVVTVAAADRNWVNWARGGSFNPSGQVRVPSVRGDGTGVFGSAVLRSFRVVSGPRPDGSPWPVPHCPPGDPQG